MGLPGLGCCAAFSPLTLQMDNVGSQELKCLRAVIKLTWFGSPLAFSMTTYASGTGSTPCSHRGAHAVAPFSRTSGGVNLGDSGTQEGAQPRKVDSYGHTL